MSRFTKELSIIPKVAWLVAFLLYSCVASILWLVAVPGDKGLRELPRIGQLAFAFGIPVILFAWVLLAGYVNADARRRKMRYIMWTLLALFVPNAIGIILYFLLRDPLPAPCPGCAIEVPGTYTFCPHCGTALAPTCPHCGKGVQRDWKNCAFCGRSLPGGAPPAP